jgi:hypothetical protein
MYSLTGRYAKLGCRTGPSGWELIPGLLKRFKNSGSGVSRSTVLGKDATETVLEKSKLTSAGILEQSIGGWEPSRNRVVVPGRQAT